MRIRQIEAADPLPIELLLLADPNEAVVRQYCNTEKVFLGELGQRNIGVYVLAHTQSPSQAEILNIAISPDFQQLGYGRKLVQHAIQTARTLGKRQIRVGTGNSSIYQIGFYQKCGFELIDIRKNYFVEKYPDPIMENGIRCKHLLLFEKAL